MKTGKRKNEQYIFIQRTCIFIIIFEILCHRLYNNPVRYRNYVTVYAVYLYKNLYARNTRTFYLAFCNFEAVLIEKRIHTNRLLLFSFHTRKRLNEILLLYTYYIIFISSQSTRTRTRACCLAFFVAYLYSK